MSRLIALCLLAPLALCAYAGEPPAIPLAGDWKFKLDPANEGLDGKWFDTALPDTIALPGSTDQGGYGQKTSERRVDMLSRVYEYVGAAWFQHEVAIPESWAGKRITLFLERCHWESQAWVDGKAAGMQDSLCAPHTYDLSDALAPGPHRITLRIDNNIKYKVGKDAHSITGHTQSNWNGIVGRIELQATDPVWIDAVRVFPNVAARTARVEVYVGNRTPGGAAGTCSLSVNGADSPAESPLNAPPGSSLAVQQELPLGDAARPWDEFSPQTYELAVSISASAGGKPYADTKQVRFGLREMGRSGSYIAVNGRPTFLRGNLECCIFPNTGYPAMDVDGWLRILTIAKSYGLNHVRFHSWCPPEAAFEAADRAGILFHIETPVWTELGSDAKLDQFIYDESDRILAAYGNHPSFCMLAVGNEPSGPNKRAFLEKIVKYWQQKDPRRLYTTCAGWPELPGSDYHVVHQRFGKPFRLHGGGPLGPGTAADYTECMKNADAPVVSHELGQWCVYPSYAEIPKYTGTLRARNLETFRESLDAHHMLDQAAAFSKASGALQFLMYKADIETILRTPGTAGYQLLSLQDFPGQGSALVGFLDAYWDSKGYATPEQFREFCNETVPLLRMERNTWSMDEAFHAEAQIAHFGRAPLTGAVPQWSVTNADGSEAASGAWEARDIPFGTGIPLGAIDLRLAEVKAPAKLTITVSIKDTPFRNHWDIWVYAPAAETALDAQVIVSDEFDAKAEKALEDGGAVLLFPQYIATPVRVRSAFEPIFWNMQWFPGQNRQLGILCDPAHPALRLFPNDGHTDWQWWDLLNQSTAVSLDCFPADFRPIVQVIDDWNKNRKLAAVFEAKVGKGRLLVCSLNGPKDSLAAAWFRESLRRYAASPDFAPKDEVTMDAVKPLFQRPEIEVVHVDSEARGYEGTNAADGDPATLWHTPWEGDKAPGFPHEIQFRLKQSTMIRGVRYVPRQDVANGFVSSFAVYVSEDGKDWGKPAAKDTLDKGSGPKEIIFGAPRQGQYLRFEARSGHGGDRFVAIAELEVLK